MRITKLRFLKKNTNKLLLLVFLLFTITSPWFWLLIRNFRPIITNNRFFNSPTNQLLTDEINTYRGEMLDDKIISPIPKLLVNKFTLYTFGVIHRYLETFDPQYLFFVGQPGFEFSTQTTGPIYLSYLPLIILGLFLNSKKRRKVLLLILFLSPLPASFIYSHYDTFLRIPVFLILTFLATVGFMRLVKIKKVMAVCIISLMLFEFLRFTNDYYFHYPRKVIESTQGK